MVIELELKTDSLSKPSRTFLIAAGLLMLLYASIMSKDITEPFQGLHSWAQAHVSWLARSHVEYGFEYTKGLNTWAVGKPPAEDPDRYLDHPQLPTLLNAVSLSVFGVNNWAQRLGTLIVSVLSLPLLMLMLRYLFDEATSLLATLIYILFPISAYFYWISAWFFMVSFLTIWSYAKVLDSLGEQSRLSPLPLYSLCASLFLMVQLGWAGFLYAAVIGFHYVFVCVLNRQLFSWKVFFTLLIAPIVSMVLVMTILIAARDWNFVQMIELYNWRSNLTGDPSRTISAWWVNYFSMMQKNYSWPVLLLSGMYFLFFLGGALLNRFGRSNLATGTQALGEANKVANLPRLRLFWIFMLPGVLYSAVFTEAMWVHNYQYAYFALLLAVSAALFILYVRKLMSKHYPAFAEFTAVSLILIIFVFCTMGLSKYHSVESYAPEKVSMFEELSRKMQPSQKLLSHESYTIMNNPAKGAHYRPEVAWHLNREILVVRDLQSIKKYASTGEYPYYLIGDASAPVFRELRARYPYQYIQGRKYRPGKAGMSSYHIFDLRREWLPSP